jgi:hypothetical protein
MANCITLLLVETWFHVDLFVALVSLENEWNFFSHFCVIFCCCCFEFNITCNYLNTRSWERKKWVEKNFFLWIGEIKNWTNLQCSRKSSGFIELFFFFRSFFLHFFVSWRCSANSFLLLLDSCWSPLSGEKRRRLVLVFVHHHSLFLFLVVLF